MKDSGLIIREYRERNGMTVADLAEKIGVSQVFLTYIENGKRKISSKVYDELKKMLSENELEAIKKWEEYKEVPENYKKRLQQLEKENKKLKANIDIGTLREDDEFVSIPLYSSVSAGYGYCESEFLQMIKIPYFKNDEDNFFAVKVRGDSMEPRIPDESIIIVKRDTEVLNNQIGAFILNGESFVKLKKVINDDVYLISLNNSYDPVRIRETDDFIEIGRVVKLLVDF